MSTKIKLKEKELLKKTVYRGSAVNFCADNVILPNGRAAVREYLDHPGAAAALAITGKNQVVMVRQYRHPIGKVTWEIPAGKLHDKKDNPLQRARRELLEETGYTAGKIKRLITFWPCCAFSNEILHIYLAQNLKSAESCPDEDEFLSVELIPFSTALRLVEKGAIKDSKTIIALQAYRLIISKKES